MSKNMTVVTGFALLFVPIGVTLLEVVDTVTLIGIFAVCTFSGVSIIVRATTSRSN